ncbi:unnamed protein product [Ixodes pacificus]
MAQSRPAFSPSFPGQDSLRGNHPTGRHPLRFRLYLLQDGHQFVEGVGQFFIHYGSIKHVAVQKVHLVAQVQYVVELITHRKSSGAVLVEGRACTSSVTGLLQNLQTRWLDEDHKWLEFRRPQHLHHLGMRAEHAHEATVDNCPHRVQARAVQVSSVLAVLHKTSLADFLLHQCTAHEVVVPAVHFPRLGRTARPTRNGRPELVRVAGNKSSLQLIPSDSRGACSRTWAGSLPNSLESAHNGPVQAGARIKLGHFLIGGDQFTGALLALVVGDMVHDLLCPPGLELEWRVVAAGNLRLVSSHSQGGKTPAPKKECHHAPLLQAWGRDEPGGGRALPVPARLPPSGVRHAHHVQHLPSAEGQAGLWARDQRVPLGRVVKQGAQP